MKSKRKLLWKIPVAILGVLAGIIFVLLIAVVWGVSSPDMREKVLRKGVAIANEKTDFDIELGKLYLSPFHHSPVVLYHAYQGKDDLSLQVEIDSLFVGHRDKDTLIYARKLRLDAKILTAGKTAPFSDPLNLPIVVEQLYLDKAAFHSDSLIATIGVDVEVGNLLVASPALRIARGEYPLHGLRLNDAYVDIDLRNTAPNTTVQDSSNLQLAFEVPDGELRNVHFGMTPLGMVIEAGSLSTEATVNVGANRYDVRRLNVGDFAFSLGNLNIPADTIYGSACADIAHNLITSSGLHVYSSPLAAKADLRTTAMDLSTMCIKTIGDAEFQGSKARLRASYDIHNEAYDATVHIDRVNLAPFLKDAPPIVLAGDLSATGRGINPKRHLSSRVKLRLDEARYGQYDLSHTSLDASTNSTTSLALNAPGLDVDFTTPMPFFSFINRLQPLITTVSDTAIVNAITTLQDLTVVETIRQRIPAMNASIALRKGSPIQPLIDSTGIDINHVDLALRTDSIRVNVQLNKARLGSYDLSRTSLAASTDSVTSIRLQTRGLNADIHSPMPLYTFISEIQPLLNTLSDSSILHAITSLSDLTKIDTLQQLIPALKADIALFKGNPIQPIMDSIGVDLQQADLSFNSDSTQTNLAVNVNAGIADINCAQAALRVAMTEGRTDASLAANTRLTDGVMSFDGLCTDAALRLNLLREQTALHGKGQLTLDSLSYHDLDLGNRSIDMCISPSEIYHNALRADVRIDDIPLDIVDSILKMEDLDLRGAVRATASVDGLPNKPDISAKVLPLSVAAQYKPYQAGLSLGETPIVMEHNLIDLNGLPIYGADSTFIAFNGGLDLNTMHIDVTLAADSFAPVKLPKGGPIPVYGDLAADIHGRVSGPLDSIVADVEAVILPTTDITYPIDKKNLAQVKPHGTVNVRYATADSVPLNLGGKVKVDDGIVRYSPKAYPVIPFHVDSGSNITFNGPIGKTQLHISASQKVKADVESKGAGLRRVNFNTGVRVNGELDSIGIKSIGFFLEAPGDEAVSKELASVDEGTREGLAAMLLTTGMYLGQSNEAAQREGYALSSIINSRVNAAIANSKVGKFMDVDFSSGKKNDMNITLSKSFFKNKLRLTIGSTISDNPEVNETKGLLSSITADYKLNKAGNLLLRLYSRRDNNNVLEGELIKTGLGVRTTKAWNRPESFRGDTILRTHGLTADAGIAYRSNNSIGPDLTLKYSLKNVLGQGETFSLKGNGAYYWAFRNRHPGDPKKTDTYKLGVNASLVFPYLHWGGDDNPDGDTRYMLGYQYENIAGGYGVHKLSGSFTYFIHSSRFITHAFTPFSLSVVLMKAESENLLDKAAEYPQLIKVIAGDEFVPSISYNFIYNNYRTKRTVNTMFDFGVKESGNLINALYCAFGHSWNEKDKQLGSITFNQFVKLTAELRNKFNITDQVSIATRLYAGANIPLGNSYFAPLSEGFYAGGPNSMRSASPYAYGPGNFFSAKYNQNFFHAGDVKLEANLELRFPIVWKLYGATFVDAGNVWNWYSTVDLFKAAGFEDYLKRFEIPDNLYDGLYNNPDFARQIALGTGAGLRLDLDGLVIRLDIGVAIHAPFQTFKYTKEGKIDTTQPINTYFNIPSALDAIRFNFGIGYPF